MKKTLAMILAGGRGKRMDPLCFERSKPALPFAGGFRVLDFTLSNCVHSGIDNFSVLVDYQRQSVADYLWQWVLFNARNTVCHILEPQNGSYKGTADAVYQNLDYLQSYNPEAVLVLAGDHVYQMDYREMLAFHEQTEADVTIGVVPVPIEETYRFGIVTIDSKSRITEFVEKPSITSSNLASMGIYIFNPKVLAEHLAEDSTQKASPHDFGSSIIPKMVKRNNVFAYKFDDYWQDIGNIEAYYETNMEFIREPAPLRLNGKWPILTKNNSHLPLEISHEDNIKHSIVSTGCIIKGEVKNSILSTGVIIEEKAIVHNSVVMANAVIGSNSIVDRCILDEKVNVGNFCFVGFGPGPIMGTRNITVLGKGVKIPSYSTIDPGRRILDNMATVDLSFINSPILNPSIEQDEHDADVAIALGQITHSK
jgi:glucose-1-phosphate adenylyltransferase